MNLKTTRSFIFLVVDPSRIYSIQHSI